MSSCFKILHVLLPSLYALPFSLIFSFLLWRPLSYCLQGSGRKGWILQLLVFFSPGVSAGAFILICTVSSKWNDLRESKREVEITHFCTKLHTLSASLCFSHLVPEEVWDSMSVSRTEINTPVLSLTHHVSLGKVNLVSLSLYKVGGQQHLPQRGVWMVSIRWWIWKTYF